MKRGRLPGKKVIQATMQEDSGLATGVPNTDTEITHKLGTTPKLLILTPQLTDTTVGHVVEVARSPTTITLRSDTAGGIDVKWKVIA